MQGNWVSLAQMLAKCGFEEPNAKLLMHCKGWSKLVGKNGLLMVSSLT